MMCLGVSNSSPGQSAGPHLIFADPWSKGWGQPQDEARWRIENKLTDQTMVPNYLDFIYIDALQAVKPEGVTLIR